MLGNLVALPLHFGSRSESKTVFINIDTMQPYNDQWNILRNITKITIYQLSNIIKDNIVQTGIYQDSLMPWEIKQDKPITFPKLTNAVLHEALYIEKLELSKQLLNKLQRLASFLNPEFYKLQNLRRSTYNTPRVVSLYDLNQTMQH